MDTWDQAASTPAEPTQGLHDPLATERERNSARWIHLGTLIASALSIMAGGIPFFVPIIVAIIVWQATKEESPFVDDHGREAVNFQISLIVLTVILIIAAIPTCGVGALLLIPLQVINIVALILAAVQAGRGNYYRYPVCIRFLHGPSRA